MVSAATGAVAELAAGVRAAGNVDEEKEEEEAGEAAHTTASTSARTFDIPSQFRNIRVTVSQ